MLRPAIFLSLIAAVLAVPVAAQEARPPGPVSTLSLALRLYAQAAQEGDALGMAVAARLAEGIRLREGAGALWQKDSGAFSPPADLPADLPGSAPVSPDLLFSGAAISGALLMAEEDEALSDLLSELPPPALRGSVSLARGTLPPKRRDGWSIPFAGQSPAGIGVFAGDSGEDSGEAADAAAPSQLWWMVEDLSGGVMCPLRPVSDVICSFTPAENVFYRVVIANPSAVAGDYMLVVN
ncbi:hypothetical protein [Pseudogemmobacter hezensis]|uniref:hypothetical protein n=1 Tax=Pseudogemmobacter hezensis TaxID=2737662 RepID=UPI001C12E016|nr:hypothetical protein [Pseudogemmobacter hezensis]